MPSLTNHKIEAKIGVSVSLPLNYSNNDLIFKLINIDNVMLYLSGLNEDPVQVKKIRLDDNHDDDDELDLSDKLADLLCILADVENEDQFEKKYEELELDDTLIFHFIYVCAGINAFHINFCSRLFLNDEDGMSPANFIERIHHGIKIFKDSGISEELIELGNLNIKT